MGEITIRQPQELESLADEPRGSSAARIRIIQTAVRAGLPEDMGWLCCKKRIAV
jgi:hypothetical protein